MRKIAWWGALICNALAVIVAFQGFRMIGSAAAGAADNPMAGGMAIMFGVVPMVYALALSIIPTCAALCVEFIDRR
jgi:hypothetical protein